MSDKNHTVFPVVERDALKEFPNCRVVDFLIDEFTRLEDCFGDITLFTDWNTRDSLTTRQLVLHVRKIASELKRRGFRPGDTIACLVHSNINYYSFLLGTWMAGCVLASLQHSFSKELINEFLRKSQARLLLCDQESVVRCLEIKEECPDLKDVFVLGQCEGCEKFDTLLERDPLITDQLKRHEPYDPDETVSIVFSSGTTGEPKGVLLSQLNIFSYLLTARPNVNRPGMKTLFVPRVGNVMGLVFGLRGSLIYTQTYLMSNYSDEYLFDAIEEIKPQRVLLYLPHILTITKHPKSESSDLSSIEAVFTAGMSISARLQKMLFSKLPSLRTYFVFYGMTEFAIATMRPFMDYERNIHCMEEMRKNLQYKPESVGRLCPMNRMKVVDEATGQTLGPFHKGELCFKGPSMFKGYWNSIEETSKIIRDGWIHTGDIGYYDNENEIFFVQRRKELIKYLGYHVFPSRLETILKSHPGVEDAAIVGIQSEEYGELPRAYTIKRKGYESLEATKLIDYLHERVGSESWLRGGLVFTDIIPRNLMGKITRHLLHSQAQHDIKISHYV